MNLVNFLIFYLDIMILQVGMSFLFKNSHKIHI